MCFLYQAQHVPYQAPLAFCLPDYHEPSANSPYRDVGVVLSSD